MLVVLTIQLRKDAWHSENLRLNKICDIAELLRSRPAMDWIAVDRAAKRLGCQRALSLGLRVAHELLGAPVNDAIAGRVDPELIGPLVEYIGHRLFDDRVSTSPMSYEDFNFRIRERWRDWIYSWYSRRAFRVVMHLRPSAKDRTMITLPAKLGFLYYLVRPIRVGRDYARSWFRGL